MTPPGASTPLDDFLAGDGSSTGNGELLERIGLIASTVGVTVAVGLLVLLAVAHRGTRGEVRLLLRWVGVAGALTLAGAVVELAGIASTFDVGWADALTGTNGSAVMMRLLAGLLLVLGVVDHVVPVGDGDVVVEPASGSVADEAGGDTVRWAPSAVSALGQAGAAIGVCSYAFDGHTLTEGPRVLHAVVDIVHVSAAGVWVGGVLGLAVLITSRRRAGASTAPLLVRFSAVATVALAAVALAGAALAAMILDRVGDLTGTEWGRLLLVKTGAVGVAALFGAYHHLVVVPACERDPDAIERRARTTITLEAIVLLAVPVVTAFLASASTV